MNEEEVSILMNTLKNGLGFTKACFFMKRHPQEISAYLMKTPSVMAKAEGAVRDAYKALLIVSNNYLKNNEYDQWKMNNEFLKTFITELNLWESFCKRAELTEEKFMKAVLMFKNPDEVATLIGMTKEDYVDYVLDHDYMDRLIGQLRHG